MRYGLCEACRKPVRLVRMIGSTVDLAVVMPADDGDVRLRDDGHGEVLYAHDLKNARRAGELLYLRHTCRRTKGAA